MTLAVLPDDKITDTEEMFLIDCCASLLKSLKNTKNPPSFVVFEYFRNLCSMLELSSSTFFGAVQKLNDESLVLCEWLEIDHLSLLRKEFKVSLLLTFDLLDINVK